MEIHPVPWSSGELETFFTERALAEREKYRAEGRAEGIERGIAAERDLLRRLAARKFDAGTAERLAGPMAGIDDPERLAEAGAWIIECASGDELIARVGDIAGSAS